MIANQLTRLVMLWVQRGQPYIIWLADADLGIHDIPDVIDQGFLQPIPQRRIYGGWRQHFPEQAYTFTDKMVALIQYDQSSGTIHLPIEYNPQGE